jgi:hypothetical protein
VIDLLLIGLVRCALDRFLGEIFIIFYDQACLGGCLHAKDKVFFALQKF